MLLQYENHEDISQELKIRCLVEMVNGCHCVAIPYYYGGGLSYFSNLFKSDCLPALFGRLDLNLINNSSVPQNVHIKL